MATPTATSQNSPFIRQLAANDKRIRDKALDSLKRYLDGRTGLSEVELLKLWKGLFFCMWQSDKPRTQQQLAIELAALIDILPLDTALDFQDAFWKTMAREWVGIDRLRMDKFLFLVRQYLHASFRLFARQHWQKADALERYLDILRETPLNPTDPKVPNGLRLHVLDIYIDELDKVDEARESGLPLEQVLAPLRELGEKSVTKAIRVRVKETLEEDERLEDWNNPKKSEEEHNGQDESEEWGGIDE
ncbi:Ribosomal RNA processing protein 1-like protein B [Lasiodiplodia hormozganensis]|uniref:Ribosomal RNA processing protein 1-like protein B n=1 Tax=Lasiodiplodia hormozganensis TaxID=869390 RepID=A0AA39YXF7_9PEZI|nr:Ribosomal RNA processing protein 1-like protein B [Lasiodiplodia hormozganensis]